MGTEEVKKNMESTTKNSSQRMVPWKICTQTKIMGPKSASGNDSIGNPQGLSAYSYLHRS